MRKFAVFDIDGTLVRWQLYHAVADQLAANGHIDPRAYRSMKAARSAWKRRTGASFRDYELEVIKIFEEVLLSLSLAQVDAAIATVFNKYKDQVYVFSRDLIVQLKSSGYLLLAISGSQIEIVQKFADYYGFDDCVGTVYDQMNGRFTGDKTVGSHYKDKALKDLVAKHGASFSGSIGIGDSHSDIAMLELVENPIVFNPEQKLFEYAEKKGWRVVVERKNMVYELESKNGKYQLVKTN